MAVKFWKAVPKDYVPWLQVHDKMTVVLVSLKLWTSVLRMMFADHKLGDLRTVNHAKINK